MSYQTRVNPFFWLFILFYLLFYLFPYEIDYEFGLDTKSWTLWDQPTVWIGEHLLGWNVDPNPVYKGFDSKYEGSRIILTFLLALFCSSLLTGLRKHYQVFNAFKLKTLVYTVIRYHLGIVLITFGLSKIFMLQFGTMEIERLETSFGDVTGMYLLWSFMSYSPFYVITVGILEFFAGLLLFFRKTSFAGALLSFIALGNVVIIDLGYEVSVRLFAIHLFLMNIILLNKQLIALYHFVWNYKMAKAPEYEALFKSTYAKYIKGALLTAIAISFVVSFQERIQEQAPGNYSDLTGFYAVETYKEDNSVFHPEDLNGKRWNALVFNGHAYFQDVLLIQFQDGTEQRYTFESDRDRAIIRLKPFFAEGEQWQELSIQEVASRNHIITGKFDNKEIFVRTRLKKKEDYILIKNRGYFFWD